MINDTLLLFPTLETWNFIQEEASKRKITLKAKIIYGLTNVIEAKTILRVICSCHKCFQRTAENYANEKGAAGDSHECK